MSDKSDNEYESDTNSEIEEDEVKETMDQEEEAELDNDSDRESGDENDSDMEDEELVNQEIESTSSENEDSDSDVEDANYLQKFDKNIHKQIIQDFHPELVVHNYEEILTLCEISRDESGEIVDPLHQTVPYVTRYEKARIIGERACQLNSGATPFIEVERDIIDGETIAIKEFEQKRIPFIVQRPLSNGGCEYWRLRDLEIL